MKKITKLLLLCTMALPTTIANAQTKPVVGTENDAYAKAYVISSYDRGGSLWPSGNNLIHQTFNSGSFWFFTNGTAENSLRFVNVKTGRELNFSGQNPNVQDKGTDLYVLANGVNNEGFCISKTATITSGSCIDASNQNNGCGNWSPSASDWNGTTWKFTEAPGYFVSTKQGLTPVDNTQYHFDSKVITLPKATKKLRFRVFSTNTGGNDPSGLYPFFTMGEFYLYKADGTQVELKAADFSTNAQSADEGPISAICDGDKTTHFHSAYNSTPNTYHYIEVTLPTEMQSFKFSFDGRKNFRNVPAVIQVLDDDAIVAANEEDAVLQALPSLKTLYNEKNYSIGTNYQQYQYSGDLDTYNTAIKKTKQIISEYFGLFTANDVTTANNNLSGVAKADFTINTPKDGSFIRIRATQSSQGTMPYLTSELSTYKSETTKIDATTRAALKPGKNGDNEANTIFYYKDQKLIAYSTGYKTANNSNFLGYRGIVPGTNVTFKESGDSRSEYNVMFNDNNRKLYTKKQTEDNTDYYYTDAGGATANGAGYSFWLEKVESLPVTVSDAGYATLCAPVALTIPANVEVYTASFDQTGVKLNPITGVIPANTGVVIEATAGKYNFAITTSEETASSDLIGNIATENIDASKAAYILGNGSAGVGFYKLNSTDRTIKGGRAYYVAPSGEAAAFLFNGTTTGIEAIEAALNDVNAPIYDLSGRKVANAIKGGVYIKNGKKFIVK